jgi:hypothetical protein
MSTIVDCAYFLDASDDDTVNPDAAVNMLETIASSLRLLSATDRADFVRHLESMTNEERSKPGDPRRLQFLQQFAASMGLAASP